MQNALDFAKFTSTKPVDGDADQSDCLQWKCIALYLSHCFRSFQLVKMFRRFCSIGRFKMISCQSWVIESVCNGNLYGPWAQCEVLKFIVFLRRYMHPIFSVLIGGILPFGAVFIELFFILTSMWLHQFYYLFGFLCLVFVILVITCAEITIVLCYFQLCSEDYHWW